MDGPSPKVQILDVATASPIGTIPLPAAGPNGIALSPDGTRAYVPLESTDQVVVVDLPGKTVVGSPIPVGHQPRAIVVDPSGTKLYTAGAGSPYSVTIVDLGGAPSPVTLTGGGIDRPESITITPDGKTVYLGNFGPSAGGTTVVPLDTATNTLGTPITAGTTITGVAVDPTGARLYALGRDNGTVTVISTATNAVEKTIALPGVAPSRIAITPNGDRAVITDRDNGTVRRIALPGGEAVGDPVPQPGATDVVLAPAQPPTAAFAVSGTPAIGQVLTFDASASTGASGGLIWSFGDGGSGFGTTVQHAYGAGGTYTATVTVSNCAAKAVFGPSGSVWAGVGASCVGPGTAVASRTVAVPAAPAAPKPAATKPKTDEAATARQGLRLRARLHDPPEGRRDGDEGERDDRRPPATVTRGKTIRARINLKGTPKKIVTVKIVVTAKGGKKTTTLRRYRTCSKKAAGRNQVKL